MRVKHWIITKFKVRRGSDGAVIDPAERGDVQAVRDRLPASLVDGKLPVHVGSTPVPAQSIIERGTVLAPASVTTTVLTYTAAADFTLTEWSGTGQGEARFEFYLNGALKQTLRTSAAQRNAQQSFAAGLKITTNDIVAVKVYWDEGTPPKTFEATIIGFR